MPCDEFENLIPEFQENRLSPVEREKVAAHLAGCADCRTFAQQLQQLDAMLSASLKVPALSADFERRLRGRIQSEPAFLTEAQRAGRKRQLQSDFDAGLARLRRNSIPLGALFDSLIWPVIGVLASWIAWSLTHILTAHLTAQKLSGFDPVLLPWLAAGIAFVAVVFPETLYRRWKIA